MATIRGKWKWNDTLNSSAIDITEFITFTLDESVNNVTTFEGIRIRTSKIMDYCYNVTSPTSFYSITWYENGYSAFLNLPVHQYINFGGTPQEISAEFEEYFVANATSVDGEIITTPTHTTISYNGIELASLEEGQTANFDCNGKKAVGAVSILFGSKGSITYKGVTTEIEAGKTANLKCAGKKFGSDVVIVTSAIPSLDAPTISLNGNILTITGMVKNAQRYGIYIDGVKQATVADPVNG